MSTVTTLIHCRTGSPSQHSKARKRKKKHIDWKGGKKEKKTPYLQMK